MKHKSLLCLLVLVLFCSNAHAQGFDPLIEKHCTPNGLDKNLVKSLIQASSGNNPAAVSPLGAVGLLQLTPAQAHDLGVTNPQDPEDNIRGGCRYLKFLADRFQKPELIVAAFDAGPTAVERAGGNVPPTAATQGFVKTVMRIYETLAQPTTSSAVYGSWIGTGHYTQFSMPQMPELNATAGKTQPFDVEITPHGSGVMLKTSTGVLGDPALYSTQLGANSLRVTYSGPNNLAIAIPNTTATHKMDFTFDVNIVDGVMKGQFVMATASHTVFNAPNLPPADTTMNYTMLLDLKRK